MENYNGIFFEIEEWWPDMHRSQPAGYVYYIHTKDGRGKKTIDSYEYFESEGEARLAAIGHISLLQQGVEHD